jgi:hypothetical protein
MIYYRKIYAKLLDWKENAKGSKALLIEGARRIGKSTIAQEFGNAEYRSVLLRPRSTKWNTANQLERAGIELL